MKRLILFITISLCLICSIAYAVTRYETSGKTTQSIVLYGKDSGTIVAIAVDSNGVIQTR